MARKSILISEGLYKDICSYCELNELNVNQFCEDMLKKLFAREKFGDVPFGSIKDEDIIINNQKTEEVKIETDKDTLNVSVSVEEKIEEPKVQEVKPQTIRKPKVRKL